MTFFYNLNKKLAGLAGTQLNEGKNDKPDYLDFDKDGDKKEPMKKALKDKESQVDEASYSAKAARAGKDIGKPGKAFSKIAADAAERYGSKERGEKVAGAVLKKLRAKEDVEEQFILEKGTKKAKPDYIDLDGDGNKKETMKKAAADKKKNAFDPETARSMFAPEKGKTKTGHEVKDTGYSKRYTKSLKDEPEDNDDDTPKAKGRKTVGAGKGKKIGAKVKGTSKLHSKGAIAECGDEDMSVSLLDKGEYDREGDMAKDDLKSAVLAAKELHSILGDDENLPEWVQSKITKALDYLNSSNQYMQRAHDDADGEMVPERKLSSSEKEEREDIVKGMKKNKAEFKKRYGKRGEEVMYATATKMAKERGPGNPDRKKKEESVEETTTAGSVATAPSDAPKKSKGGMQFGKGVYENFNSQVESMITESMNVNVSMSTGQNGEPTKSITVSAEGEDAEMLAQLLNLAGLHGQQQQVDEVDENNPDWPTDEETTGNDDPQLQRWAGGLNKPKSTGQTTIPVIASQLNRQVSEDKLGMNLYAELKSFKAK